jgi:hypothetical protein
LIVHCTRPKSIGTRPTDAEFLSFGSCRTNDLQDGNPLHPH